MKALDVVGKRIVSIQNERISGDREYYGPRIICTSITLEDGTQLLVRTHATVDQPVGEIIARTPARKEQL
jgi:hypothetical protein